MLASSKFVAAGTRVRVRDAGPVPSWSEWDCDGGRTSTSVKKRLQKQFFSGDKRISAEVLYISNESERERMRGKGRVKLQIRDAAGSLLVISACAENLVRA
ncbi:MAG: hypothetical protein HZB38_06705 [Planctomycetes bacterium]|nr:hypothetical protein [Planctomycetota bacterium]